MKRGRDATQSGKSGAIESAGYREHMEFRLYHGLVLRASDVTPLG